MKKRIISAIGMTLVILPFAILGKKYFAIFTGIVGVFALKEVIDLKEHHKKIPEIMFFISIVNLLLFIFSGYNGYGTIFGLNYRIISLLLLSLFVPTLFYKNDKYRAHEAIYLCGSILFLGLSFNGLILIRNYNMWHLFYLASIAITTDIFAMLIGRSPLGKHKSAPVISPNKTWEGTIGGTIIGTSIATIFYSHFIGGNGIGKVICITFVLSIVGQVGDLFFSKIKRENKTKDFSSLIPGHGGILDRLDSLLFIVLTYIIVFEII